MHGNPGVFRAELMLRGFCAKIWFRRESASHRRRVPAIASPGLGIREEDVVEVMLELMDEKQRHPHEHQTVPRSRRRAWLVGRHPHSERPQRRTLVALHEGHAGQTSVSPTAVSLGRRQCAWSARSPIAQEWIVYIIDMALIMFIALNIGDIKTHTSCHISISPYMLDKYSSPPLGEKAWFCL